MIVERSIKIKKQKKTGSSFQFKLQFCVRENLACNKIMLHVPYAKGLIQNLITRPITKHILKS